MLYYIMLQFVKRNLANLIYYGGTTRLKAVPPQPTGRQRPFSLAIRIELNFCTAVHI